MTTLEEVQAAFHEWRTTKKKKWERIPDELISMAKGLLTEHSVGTVSFRLGIALRKLEVPKEVETLEERFVEVPRAEIVASPSPSSSVTVRVRPGKKNEISISVPTGGMNWPEFLKGLSKI
jgi:hypothetical protein